MEFPLERTQRPGALEKLRELMTTHINPDTSHKIATRLLIVSGLSSIYGATVSENPWLVYAGIIGATGALHLLKRNDEYYQEDNSTQSNP